MRKIGFDNDQYVRLQSERIRQRISKFGGKLYLEFGGKLFDDFHRNGSLTRCNGKVIEGMYESISMLFRQLVSLCACFIIYISI